MLLFEAARQGNIDIVSAQPSGLRLACDLLELRSRHEVEPGGSVRIRILCQHSHRYDATARDQSEALLNSGAEIRTVASLAGGLVILNRALALIPATMGTESATASVRDPNLVGFLYSCFEHTWATAKELETRQIETVVISEELKREIIRMLVDGAKDDAIARRLGLSVRTCRKHVGQLMRRYGVSTRFQLGYAVRAASHSSVDG